MANIGRLKCWADFW